MFSTSDSHQHLIFSMETDEEFCRVPDAVNGAFAVPASRSPHPCDENGQVWLTSFSGEGEMGFGHSVYNERSGIDIDLRSTPKFETTVSGSCFYEPSPCLSDAALIQDQSEWLEEVTDLSNFLRKEALSPSNSSLSSLGGDSSVRLQSPMEIYQEIRIEASKFSPSSDSSPKFYTNLEPLEPPTIAEETAAELPPALHLVPTGEIPAVVLPSVKKKEIMEPAKTMGGASSLVQPVTTVVPSGAQFLGSFPVRSEVNPKIPAAADFLEKPANLQVVQIVGDKIVFPDGTEAKIVPEVQRSQPVESAPGTSTKDREAGEPTKSAKSVSKATRRRAPYQKSSYERKKQQNRESASRYRQKKAKEENLLELEFSQLLEKNLELKKNVDNLEQEIKYWKKFMKEMSE